MTDNAKEAAAKSRREWLIVIAGAAIVLAGILAYRAIGPVSADDRRRYGSACTDWISREFADGQSTRIIDSWRRRGSPVFLIAYRSRWDTSDSILLCVADRRSGNLIKPSAFDTSWRRLW